MVLNGHEHFYQHFGPMDANGNLVNGGVSQFIVGTGGVNLGSAATSPARPFSPKTTPTSAPSS